MPVNPYDGNGYGCGIGYGYCEPAPSSAAPLLLDNLPQFRIAVATKKLRTDYSGNCMQVRRSSDSTTSNYGFVSGVVDSASYDTFCGAGDGALAAWYDQSGSGNNLTQATTTRQPLVVSSGSVEVFNGSPAVKFSSHFIDSGTLTYSRPFHRFLVLNFNSTASNQFLHDGQGYDVASLAYYTTTKTWEAYNGSSIKRVVATHPTSVIVEGLWNGASSRLRLNDDTTTGNTGTGTLPTKVRIGASGTGTVFLQASVLAFLEYDGALTTEQVAAVRDGLNELYGVF